MQNNIDDQNFANQMDSDPQLSQSFHPDMGLEGSGSGHSIRQTEIQIEIIGGSSESNGFGTADLNNHIPLDFAGFHIYHSGSIVNHGAELQPPTTGPQNWQNFQQFNAPPRFPTLANQYNYEQVTSYDMNAGAFPLYEEINNEPSFDFTNLNEVNPNNVFPLIDDANHFLASGFCAGKLVSHTDRAVLPMQMVPVFSPPAGFACLDQNCDKIFKRNSDRVRHEASVHGISQRLHLCPVVGCVKSQGTGYSRADKVKEHLWKQHADLGYNKRTS